MADRRRKALPAWKSLVPAGIGVLLLLGSGVLFLVARDDLADERAYRAASACPAGTHADACTNSVPATVEATETQPYGKGVRYWLHFTERGDDSVQRIRMADADPVYERLSAGDEITVTYWRGEIRRVGLGGVVQETKASVVDDWRISLGAGLALVSLGLGMLWTSWWQHNRYPSAPYADAWQLSVGFLTGMAHGGVGFFAALAGDDVPEVLLIALAGVPPVGCLAVLLAWWLRRRARRVADTSGIVPVPPDGRRVVRAGVHGDVPYSVAGFGHLVLGDGRPAATPDPDGRIACRTLPETLTVRDVRALQPGDPDGWMGAYNHDCVVVECRDGDRTVLVGTRRRDAPAVLGALLPACPGAPSATGAADAGGSPRR
ncbi:hypothetical protein [Streptomyces sp. JJ36]|uniref:hypothetical protein n=1 Tax=Streptomyces sp. JJ36 TaxID=2736645 RepID=UPI001F311578|nr:hypothetical protein [Streptomyces sp. JJ36]MCF6524239.1 hypothetical protein [Streptomyces sp. JJ36]